MKPIQLKIKGLNSFIEEQIIDFEALSKHGFFGIFGPTGSGKSTILDGMILALYGEDPRKSADFININCDKAYVQFKFQISGKETKVYLVEREYRRDKKTLKPRSGKCKLADITSENIQILEESVTSINSKCTEIIGLSKDDFMRTVVLPQGKFSEFLKMEGKNRSDMLERLFNLYEYGENLTWKIKKQSNALKLELEKYKGEIAGVGEMNPELLSDLENRLRYLEEDIQKEQAHWTELKAKAEFESVIFDLQNQKKIAMEELNDLTSKNEFYENQKLFLAKLRQAAPLLKLSSKLQLHTKLLETAQVVLDRIESDKKTLELEQKDTKVQFQLIQEKYIQEKPQWQREKEKLDEALLILEEWTSSQVKKNHLQNQKLELALIIKNKSIAVNSLKQNLEVIENDLIVKRQALKELKVDDSYRLAVQKASELNKFLEIKKEQQNELILNIESLKLNQFNASKDLNALNQILIEEESKKKEINQAFIDLEFEKPNDAEKLNEKLQRLTDMSYKLADLNRQKEHLAAAQRELSSLAEIREEQIVSLKHLDQQYKEKAMALKQAESKMLAEKLQADLKEGEPCPVCGSLHHDINLFQLSPSSESFHSLEDSVKSLENDLLKARDQQYELQAKISAKDEQIKNYQLQIQGLESFCSEDTYAEEKQLYNQMEKSIETFNLLKEELQLSLNKQINKIVKIESDLSSQNKQLKTLDEQLQASVEKAKHLKNEIEGVELAYHDILKVHSIPNILEAANKVRDMDRQYTALSEKVEASSNEVIHQKSILTGEEGQLSKFIEEENLLINELSVLDARLEGFENQLIDFDKNPLLLNQRRTELTSQISEIEIQYKNLQNQINQQAEQFHKLSEMHIEKIKEVSSLEKEVSENNKQLLLGLAEGGFETLDSLTVYDIPVEQMQTIEQKINSYYERLFKVSGKMEALDEKLKGQSVDEEIFKATREAFKSSSSQLENLKHSYIIETQKIEQMKGQLERIASIQKNLEKIQKKQAILAELEGLFKGKRFVQYVATERLKYISREASLKLLDITNGMYGLETDSDGKFLIRDNKNGGVLRETSTLSGGETFVTSLALSLALSSEIQLKGAAPLELFFLDEGFGTLDEDLLEVLMSALESIHHDKLKIGIISHVETIKNRVPIKLNVQPALSGEGGSKVKIELN